VSFNVFLLQPVLGEVQKAIDGFRARGAKAIIIDLRGNPGGIGAMVIPLAARLSTAPLTLGTIVYRDFSNTLATTASLGIKPFTGRVIILTDEGSASTSEILCRRAAGSKARPCRRGHHRGRSLGLHYRGVARRGCGANPGGRLQDTQGHDHRRSRGAARPAGVRNPRRILGWPRRCA
jgi:hypothetical protein